MQPFLSPNLTLARQSASYLNQIQRGLEKESLRITPDGCLSDKPHPKAWGAALTSPFITTDYSEALPEFITAPTTEFAGAIAQLKEIHQFCYHSIGDELLWIASMPCVMGDESAIPIARYGSSNSAHMKEIYREGLGHRYGRLMQTIAGVHYNFSLPETFWQSLYQQENAEVSLQDYISDKYMGLIRNYLRYAWIIPYFWGASPAICQSFLKGKNAELEELVPGTRYGKYATSLRMSDLGYQNKVQSLLNVSYNSLPEYIQGLEQAIRTPDPLYQQIGVVVDGQYRQLNANILQIENEFYGIIRPKRTSKSGQRPTKALKEQGIEYLEIRALDLNPYAPCGISQQQIAFLDAFLLTCLFLPSHPITPREMGEIREHFRAVVARGRHPDLTLIAQNRQRPIRELLGHILGAMKEFAGLLDTTFNQTIFSQTLKSLDKQIDNSALTISGKLVAEIEERGDGFFPMTFEWSNITKQQFLEEPLSADKLSWYQQIASESHQQKAKLESADSVSFETFLEGYYR